MAKRCISPLIALNSKNNKLVLKVKVRFTHFAVEEQSKFLQNWHELSGDDVCIDSVQVAWANSTRLFCDESHQNSREFTFSDNKEYDPNLLGWFSWVDIDAAEFAIKFSSRELGGSGTASFVGFGLQWECQDNIYDECLNKVHSCDATEECVDLDNGYTCIEQGQSSQDKIHVTLEEIPTDSLISERSLQMKEFGCATCHPKAECVNSKCVCMDGFKGTGYSCAPIGGRCKKPARNPCSKNAICEDQTDSKTGKPISPKCTCKEGYTGSGKKCVKTSKICSDKCDQNAICINSECICNVGFNGDGRSCKKLVFNEQAPAEKPKSKSACVLSEPQPGSSCFQTLEKMSGFVTCGDSFKTKVKKEKLHIRMNELVERFCNDLEDNRPDKCVDSTTPLMILYNKIMRAKSFAEWTEAMRSQIKKRLRYCRNKRPYAMKIEKLDRLYERVTL